MLLKSGDSGVAFSRVSRGEDKGDGFTFFTCIEEFLDKTVAGGEAQTTMESQVC